MASSSKPSSSSAKLADYLWETPLLYNCVLSQDAKHDIIERLYEALWNGDENIRQQYYFATKESLEAASKRQSLQKDGKEPNSVHSSAWHTNSVLPPQDMSSQRGRQCGHVFRKGEPVYRCSPGSGGCCDCGDPEAWKTPLQCRIHSPDAAAAAAAVAEISSGRAFVPPEVIKHMQQTFTTVLDFMLDCFALAPEEVALPSSTEALIKESRRQRNVLQHIGIPSHYLKNPVGRSNTDNLMETEPSSGATGCIEEEDVDVDMDKCSGDMSDLHTKIGGSIGSHSKTENEEDEEDDEDNQLYACIAWNDEAHAFSHVLECIQSATGCDWEKAKHIIDVIHVHGREIIATSHNIDELRKVAAPLAAINFGVTIRPAQETFREQVCGLLVDWLKELVNGQTRFFNSIEYGDGVIRSVLCETLCGEWELRLPLALLTTETRNERASSEAEEDEDEIKHERGEIGIGQTSETEDVEMFDPDSRSSSRPIKINSPQSLDTSPIIYRNQCDVASIDWEPAAMVKEYQQLKEEEERYGDMLDAKGTAKKPLSDSAAGKRVIRDSKDAVRLGLHMQKEFEEKLRLDYLMLYDLKLWKEVRISLRELYISTLASSTVYKKVLGRRLARNYARLAESFLLKDREPENSIILFSVQLLTVPTVSDLLVNEYYFFGIICSTLAAFFLTDHLRLLLPSQRLRLPTRINCESRAFRTRRYFNAFHDLRYIMNVDMIKQVLAMDPIYLRQYLDLISLFQGMNAQTCQKDTHVEYESEIWVNAFNVTLQIAKCCRQFSDCFSMLPTNTLQEKVDTARALVHAITRVLKQIEEWRADDSDDPMEPSSKQPNSQPSISGTAKQVFHEILLPHMPPFAVIKYSVCKDPVSFHHPLHWLLAGLLEYASLLSDDVLREAGWTGGFLQVITLYNTVFEDGNDTTDVLLPILDFPIRTVVFSSQIRAGVWVRNGYGIRNQAHHYRDISLRENTYDADVFLLQLGFVTIDPSRFLATLMDRFDLVSWFMGTTKHENYDPSQTVFMAEEILNLLVVCVCERANVTGMSIQGKIRREIIHNLCLEPAAYSELTKRIPERLSEHPDFDHILSSVANFKSPMGVNDHGRYELQTEWFSEVDTYFWHYSRNNREEAEAVLKNRWKKANPKKPEEEFFILPKTDFIGSGPFKYIGAFLHTPVFNQMITYALWNVRMSKNHKSDTILDQTLHLILLALTDKNSVEAEECDGFYRYVCETSYPLTSASHSQEHTLFEVMTIFRDEELYSEVHGRFDWIFDRLENCGCKKTSEIVNAWKYSRLARLQQKEEAAEGSVVELSDIEKKKAAAKERQMKIMAQFAQAQSQFMEKNEGLYEDELDDAEEGDGLEDASTENPDEIHRFCSYPSGTCILCQEDVNERSPPYGILGLIQASNILREAPMDSTELFEDIQTMGPSLDVEWPDRQILPENHNGVVGFPAQNHKTGLYTSTCGHLMHIKCFEAYCSSIDSRHVAQMTRNHPENRSRKEFMCPLCKSLGNTLFPVFTKGKKESYPGVLVKTDNASYTKFLQTGVQSAAEKMKQMLGPHRANFGPRRRSSGASKLKDAIATWVPSLRTTPGGQAVVSDDWISRRPTGFPSSLSLEPSLTMQQDDSVMHYSDRTTAHSPTEGRLGVFDEDVLYLSAISSIPAIKKSYGRLFDVTTITFREIAGDEIIKEMSTPIKNVDLLWAMLGYTIMGVEIAARGSAKPKTQDNPEVIPTGTLFDQIPSQTQILLRVLSDTVIAYTSLMSQQDSSITSSSISPGLSPTMMKIHVLALGRLRQIFPNISLDDLANVIGPNQEKIIIYDNTPLLEDDPFMILSELSLHMASTTKSDIYPFVRTLFLAEITKVTIALLRNQHDQMCTDSLDYQNVLDGEGNTRGKIPVNVSQEDCVAASEFAFSVMEKMQYSSDDAALLFRNYGQERFCSHLQGFILPFLRRALVLMIVRFGLIVPPLSDDDDDFAGNSGNTGHRRSELSRLLDILKLPNFETMLQRTPEHEHLISAWCKQHIKESQRRWEIEVGSSENAPALPAMVRLDMPTPLYLVALPRRLDQLFDESMRRVCNKCGTVPTDPALCLFCGTFVCAQSFCCSEEEEGECNLHTLECGGDIGVFLSVKRCVLILLHNGNGWFIDAPYLDSHGEVDQGLRRGKPQYLNTKRYSEIRKLWLQHTIPVYIARQIEANYDIGGWTTM
ncbi:hypothetical protein J3Q64DRAFT_1811303 [Phycomyces blakesleeanus]|uniref:E3 ubiquitin-protein ligase n=1 Tax=Phycomyces blakesleeanus TaxID=4837 RepID=A0ABR3ALF4_PHYBL